MKRLPDAEDLKEKYRLTNSEADNRLKRIEEVEAVLDGTSNRKLLIIGPCSADREDSVLDYMVRLSKLSVRVSDKILIIPRIYTSKPRTKGSGYKGLLHRPNPQSDVDDISMGIEAVRKLHIAVIRESGLFGADEMLYPEAHYYISDLLCYTAVGAHSVENQQHRLVSSGLDMPVGMKNPISGDISVMLNAIHSAQSEQSLIYHGYECRTNGNMFAHAVLRGSLGQKGEVRPNYHSDDIRNLYREYSKKKYHNPALIVDCNHSNSGKDYLKQQKIGLDVLDIMKSDDEINRFVKGFMVESYLVDGKQLPKEGVYGQSITDPCLGWEKTEELIYKFYDMLRV